MANGGGGALEAQQRIGAEIPYKNIQETQAGLGLALSAFAHASQISNNRRKLEEMLVKMDYDQRFKEQDFERKVAQMNMTAALQTAEHNRKMDSMENQMTRAAWTMDWRDKVQNWKENLDLERDKQLSSFAESMKTLPEPTDPGYEAAIWDRIHNHARGANTPVGRILASKAFNDRNTVSRTAASKWTADYNAFIKDYKNTVGAGSSTNLAPLLNMEMWKPQLAWETPRPGQEAPGLTEEGKIPKGAIYTKKRFIDVPDPSDITGRKKMQITLPEQKIKQLQSEYQSLMERRGQLPTQVNNEFVTAYPSGVTSTGLSNEDMQAINWARAHKNDPRAAKIFNALGVNE